MGNDGQTTRTETSALGLFDRVKPANADAICHAKRATPVSDACLFERVARFEIAVLEPAHEPVLTIGR